MVCPPIPPKLFLCEKCKEYFYTFSKLKKPTHPKCFSHKTRLATQNEKESVGIINDIISERRKRI